MNSFVPILEVESLASGQARTITVEGKTLAVLNWEGTFFVLDDHCPHRGGPLGAGLVQEGTVFCPLHGWGFDLRTGACRDRPDRPVRTYPVRVHEGRIEVCLGAKAINLP